MVSRRFTLRMFSALAACALLGCDGSKPGGGSAPPPVLPPPAPGVVRVISWNLEWFPGRSPNPTPQAQTKQEEAVRAALAGQAPDNLLAQEVKSETALAQVLPPERYKVATTSRFSGAQQLCIAGRIRADSAWFEPWRKDGRDDPPRGFAFASFRLPSGRLLMVYTVHLKSNAGGDKAANRAKREDAARQLIGHIRSETAKRGDAGELAVLVAGDFNTDPGQRQFEGERTLKMFEEAGFTWALASLPRSQTITWPAADGFPDATFDHILVKGIQVKSVLVPGAFDNCSDHRPVVVDLAD